MQLEEEITEEEVAEVKEEAKTLARPRRQMAVGVVLSVFSAIVLIMIGGLASYYYYTIQSQGGAAESVLKDTWKKTVDGARDVTDEFAKIVKYEDLAGDAGSSLTRIVSAASRDARDSAITITDLDGLSIKSTEAADKLDKFLLTEAEVWSELRKLLEKQADIKDASEIDKLNEYVERLSKEYEELLLSGRGLVQGDYPRAVFDLADDFKELLSQKSKDATEEDAAVKVVRQAAESVVAKFAEAWKNRDGDGMKNQLTAGAKGEFNAGILEDSSDIVSLRITSSKVADDKASVAISGSLEKETPDQQKVTEQWNFRLLKQGETWLIDSWKR